MQDKVLDKIFEVGLDEKPVWSTSQKQKFINNLTKMNFIVDSEGNPTPDADYFNMMSYAKFYCIQDVMIPRSMLF